MYEAENIRHHIRMVGLQRGVFSKRLRFLFNVIVKSSKSDNFE